MILTVLRAGNRKLAGVPGGNKIDNSQRLSFREYLRTKRRHTRLTRRQISAGNEGGVEDTAGGRSQRDSNGGSGFTVMALSWLYALAARETQLLSSGVDRSADG
ncbi:MAG: hypothetical protein U1D97_07810 [Desulfuromonadales bacterium]|nr:hypothetical protein [Desulfuromonadales bacterium]